MGLASYLKETAKNIASDAYAMAVNRMSHGASEVAQALFTGGPAYVPYGQNSMPVSAPEVGPGDAPAIEPETPAADVAAPSPPGPAVGPPAPSLSEQYQAQVAMYAAMRGPSPTHQSPGL